MVVSYQNGSVQQQLHSQLWSCVVYTDQHNQSVPSPPAGCLSLSRGPVLVQVISMIKSSALCGSSIIAYLQAKGYPEVRLIVWVMDAVFVWVWHGFVSRVEQKIVVDGEVCTVRAAYRPVCSSGI